MQAEEREREGECDSRGCSCAVGRERASRKEARGRFCSEECARGHGCEHVSCACGALCDV